MAINIKKKIKLERNRTFLAKDFDSLRADLLQYARTYFPDKIQDFTETSLGGLFLDMAAFVGDTMSFYLDHQFNELNPATATETANIIRHLRSAGVPIVGAAPASVLVELFIEVPSEINSQGSYAVKASALPIILDGTILKSASGVSFNMIESLDFAEKDDSGNYKAKILISETDSDGNPSTFIMSKEVLCISGSETIETFTIPDAHKPFREITLTNEDVSDIAYIRDSEGNVYYEVESLSQDTVFKGVMNFDADKNLVPMNLEVIAAPRRFVKRHSPTTRLTTIRFGSGDGRTLDDDIVPDPSELSLPLYGKTVFSKFSIDPNSLLKTQTLGIAPINTTISVSYRHGGGLNHNVAAESIRFIDTLRIEFRKRPSAADATFVRNSFDVKNNEPARGGDRAPTITSLRSKIASSRQMQSRTVTKQDLLARIYTMPSKFGRVFRAGIIQNPVNPLSTQLFIVSRGRSGELTVSPDTLKLNLSKYLNEFRLISDAMDILDARIINFGVRFDVLTHPTSNKQSVVQKIIQRLKKILVIKNYQIDQPIVLDDITNMIINTQGVISLINLEVTPITGRSEDRVYSNSSFNFERGTKNGIIVPPPGSIFELKFPNHDIKGTAS